MYKILLVIISTYFLSIIYTSQIYANNNIKLDFNLTNNLYIESKDLNSTLFLYKSDIDLSEYNFSSTCRISSKLVWTNKDYYLFKLIYLDNECNSEDIFLVNQNEKIIRTEKVKIFNNSFLYNYFLDFNYLELEWLKYDIEKKIYDLSASIKNNSKIKIKENRKIKENNYILWIINHILLKRNEKYIIPVSWKVISNSPSRIPNARRPYRSDITDWIHHWWDVYWPLEDKAISIDDSLVIRVVSGFKYSDLWKLNKSSNLSDLDKAKNLDIYRWNQVWLKTMKWDIVFYSHLTNISENIKEWKLIKKGDFIWTTGITWVPDKNYKDYHLHFTIHKTPYTPAKVWKYTIDNYLLWDWYFKWKPLEYVLKNQDNIFMKNK